MNTTLKTLLAAAATTLLLAPAAGAAQRPAKPPLPSPMPPVVKMDKSDPLYELAAGYWDGERIVLADPSYKFGVRHELGHVVDERYLDAGERNRFAELQSQEWDIDPKGHETMVGHDGTEDLPWFSWAVDPGSDVVTSSYTDIGEKFADAYAACRSGYIPASNHIWETGYGYNPVEKQHRAICKFIVKAMQDAGEPAKVEEDGGSIAWR